MFDKGVWRCFQLKIGRGFVHVSDFDGEVFGRREAFAVGRCNRHVDAISFFVVQAHAFGQTKFSIDHFEAIIGNGILNRVAGVRIKRRKRANNGALSIFSHRRIVERKIAWPFIHVRNIDGERLHRREAVAIRCRNFDIDRSGVFMIQAHTFGKAQLTIDDLKAVIRNAVSHAVASVRIHG